MNIDLNNAVFLDLEANCQKRRGINDVSLLQASAIKIKDGLISYFNESCFYKEIWKRISNLLEKPINYFNNNEFIKSYECFEKLNNFIEGLNVYVFGNFDQIIIDSVFKKYKNKLKHLQKIKLVDIQKILINKMRINKNKKMKQLSLMSFARILNYKFSENHNPLDDAITLYEMTKIVFDDAFDVNKYYEKLDFIEFYPKKTSREYVNYLQNQTQELKENFNFVFFYWKTTQVSIDKIDNDVSLIMSCDLINEFNKIKTTINEITINVCDNNTNIVSQYYYSFNDDEPNKNKIILEIKNIIEDNAKNLFITNKKNLMEELSKEINQQFYFLSLNKPINEKNERINLINNIKKAKELFD